MNDIITVSVVNFRPIHGEKKVNLKRIKEYILNAGKRGVDLIAFPEMALTGYDDDPSLPKEKKMSHVLAESLSGPSVSVLKNAAKESGVFAVVGFPERKEDNENVYNSACVVTPEGEAFSYQKIHIPRFEGNWAVPGECPLLFETPWGPIGVSICYDTYQFPELCRYYRAKGARLVINCTACGETACAGQRIRTELEANSIMNNLYIASSSLCGVDDTTRYIGCSSIVGPSVRYNDIKYYAGYPFFHPEGEDEEVYTATIDLSLADYNTHFSMFQKNPRTERADFTPGLYGRLYHEIEKTKNWYK